MIRMFSSIKENSLLLIDEPEISLHPNWQMKYISFLKEVFKNYCSCQFIITTHSHFIVSDLEGKNSSVIALKRNQKSDKIEAELIEGIDTFGWSAEEVLLKVFQVATSRNYFIAEKLGLILDFIAGSNSTRETIKNKFFELELDKFDGLTDEDPMKTVYDTIVSEYVS